MTDPFSPEGPAIPGKVEKTKKGRRGGSKRTTWQEEEGEGHLVKDHEDKLAGKEGSLGKTWQLCEQPDAHTSFHSLLHVLVLKEVGITVQSIGDKLVGGRHIVPGKFCPTFGGNILSQESGHFVTKCPWEENFCPTFGRHNSVISWG